MSVSVASTPYPVGEYGPIILDGLETANGFRATFSRDGWPDGVVLHVDVDRDDGTGFVPWLSADFIGEESSWPTPVSCIVGFWPGKNDGYGGREAISHKAVRLKLVFIQPVTTSIHVEAI